MAIGHWLIVKTIEFNNNTKKFNDKIWALHWYGRKNHQHVKILKLFIIIFSIRRFPWFEDCKYVKNQWWKSQNVMAFLRTDDFFSRFVDSRLKLYRSKFQIANRIKLKNWDFPFSFSPIHTYIVQWTVWAIVLHQRCKRKFVKLNLFPHFEV